MLQLSPLRIQYQHCCVVPVMYCKKFLSLLPCIGTVFSLTLPQDLPIFQQSSNLSSNTLPVYNLGSNTTLHAWPAVPWILRVSSDITLNVIAYSDPIHLEPERLNEIGEAIDWIILEIGSEGDQSALISHNEYQYLWTEILFFPSGFPVTVEVQISRTDAKRIVEAVGGLFFGYGWGPRKFLAQIRVNGQVRGGLKVGFEFYIDA